MSPLDSWLRPCGRPIAARKGGAGVESLSRPQHVVRDSGTQPALWPRPPQHLKVPRRTTVGGRTDARPVRLKPQAVRCDAPSFAKPLLPLDSIVMGIFSISASAVANRHRLGYHAGYVTERHSARRIGSQCYCFRFSTPAEMKRG
jgi:hypothetical protein